MSEVEAQKAPKKPKQSKPVDVVQEKEGPAQQWTPTYQSMSNFESHLFELNTSKMLKNHSYKADDASEIRPIDHQHFFHSIDSSGKAQTHSTPTGAHFHQVTVTWDKKTGAPTAVCSGPMTFMNKKGGGKVIKPVPAFKAVDQNGDPIIDTHTHDIVYLRTSSVKPRTVNKESVTVIDKLETQRSQKIPGIVG